MSEFARKIERKIKGKLSGIKNGTVEVENSGLNSMIDKLEQYDAVAAEEMRDKYLETVRNLNKD